VRNLTASLRLPHRASVRKKVKIGGSQELPSVIFLPSVPPPFPANVVKSQKGPTDLPNLGPLAEGRLDTIPSRRHERWSNLARAYATR
jgi:hypothetical protein